MSTFADFGTTKEKVKLDCGVPLVHFKKKDAPIFMRTYISAGARNAPDGKEGLTHFYEHLITFGTEKFPTSDKLSSYIEGVGGEFEAYTNTEFLALEIEVPSKNEIKHAAVLLSEMLQHPKFDEKSIESEKTSIIQEIGNYKSDPAAYIWELADELFFQETANAKSVLGSEESIKNITKQDLLDYKDKYVNSNNVVIVSAGDININEFKKALDKEVKLEPGKKNKPTKPLPKIRKNKIAIQKYGDTDQIQINFGFRILDTLNGRTPEHTYLNLIALMIGSGGNSLLAKKLRHKQGLVYDLDTMNVVYVDAGLFVIDTATEKGNLNQVLSIIYKELKSIANEGFTEKQLEFIKNREIKSIKRLNQTPEDLVDFHGYDELYFPENVQNLPDYISEIENTTLQDINKTAKKYLDLDNWYLALCGNVEENDINFMDD